MAVEVLDRDSRSKSKPDLSAVVEMVRAYYSSFISHSDILLREIRQFKASTDECFARDEEEKPGTLIFRLRNLELNSNNFVSTLKHLDSLLFLAKASFPAEGFHDYLQSVDRFIHADLVTFAVYMNATDIVGKSSEQLKSEVRRLIEDFGLEQFERVASRMVYEHRSASAVAESEPLETIQTSVKVTEARLPKEATELYKNREDTSEDGPAFFKRVYKDYIGNSLTRAVLDKLDHPLVARIDALKRKKDPEALALDLPTAWVAPQKWADRVLAGEETAPEVADLKTHTRNRMRITKARERAATKER